MKDKFFVLNEFDATHGRILEQFILASSFSFIVLFSFRETGQAAGLSRSRISAS